MKSRILTSVFQRVSSCRSCIPTALSAAIVVVSLGLSELQDVMSAEERFQALDKEFSAQATAYRQAIKKAGTQSEKREIANEKASSQEKYARRFLDLANEAPKARTTVEALRAAIVLGSRSDTAYSAIEQLRRDWVAEARISEVCLQIAASPNPNGELLLREVLAMNPDRNAQGVACLALARILAAISNIPRVLAEGPQAQENLERRLGKAWFDQLRRRDFNAIAQEAEALYERAHSQYGAVKVHPELAKSSRLVGQEAETWLLAHRELKPGANAPEIEGKDMDGQSLKLSDFRGKVVVISFWASWCGPCMAELPHEREMVKRLEGKPFVFLGVNHDRSEEAARAVLSKEGITWRNVYDGSRDDHPIADLYHIQALPTIYIIDPRGVIRAKQLRGDALLHTVEMLLAEK